MHDPFWPRKGTRNIEPVDQIFRAPIGTLLLSLAAKFLCLFVAKLPLFVRTASVYSVLAEPQPLGDGWYSVCSVGNNLPS